MAAEICRPHPAGDSLEAGLADRSSRVLTLDVVRVPEEGRAGEDHRHRVRDVLAEEGGSGTVGRLGHQRRRHVVVPESDEHRLGAGDRAKERQDEVGEDVTVAVECGNHHR